MGRRPQIAPRVFLCLVVATLAAGSATPGAQLWVTRYDDPDHGYDQPWSVGVSPDGSKVFVTGNSDQPGRSETLTFSFDSATGTELWRSLYTNPNDLGDWADALAISPDGSMVFITGEGLGSNADDYVTVATVSGGGAGTELDRVGVVTLTVTGT